MGECMGMAMNFDMDIVLDIGTNDSALGSDTLSPDQVTDNDLPNTSPH